MKKLLVLETKNYLIHFFVFTHLPDLRKHLLRAALEKGVLNYLVVFVKQLRKLIY